MNMNLEFNVTLYETNPTGVLNTIDAVSFAVERLKLYEIFQKYEYLSQHELLIHLGRSQLKNLLKIEESDETLEARKIDYIGHWILRVAYSNTYPEFFIKNELRWLKVRYNSMTHIEKKKIVSKSFKLEEVSGEEKKLLGLTKGRWYKLNWTKVVSLVKLQMYPMERGYIFIPEHKIQYCFFGDFERNLKQSLVHIKKKEKSWPENLKRILSFIDLVKPYEVNVSNFLKLSDLDDQVKHFPMCMKYLYENLRKNAHLKHFSRVQLGLFLKALGLPLKEALELWKGEFTKKMTEEFFNKEYLYFFKHQYGTVGSKIDYKAQSCDEIIEAFVGPDQSHGCPFRHWDNDFLIKRLKEEIICDEEIDKIIQLKSQNKCKESCTLYFKCSKNDYTIKIIKHPVQFYKNSCKLEEMEDILDIEDLFKSDSENC